MFSTMPRTGTLTLRNIARPLRASISATSCGVVTMTAPVSGTFWVLVRCAAPRGGVGSAGDLIADLRFLVLKVQREGDVPVVVDGEVAHESERDDVARQAGKLHLAQRATHLLLRWHRSSPL